MAAPPSREFRVLAHTGDDHWCK